MRFAIRCVLTVLSMGSAVLLAVGCEERPRTTSEKVEVKDKLLGGQEVEKTKVIEQGDKVQVQKTETDIDSKGNVTEKETEIKGDKID